jgi:hypothetical protein
MQSLNEQTVNNVQYEIPSYNEAQEGLKGKTK